MKRRLFTVVSALSLLLFVVVCVLWVAALVASVFQGVGRDVGRWGQPYVAWRDGERRGYAVLMTRGGVSLEARSLPWAVPGWPARSVYNPSPRYAVESVDRMLFHMARIRERGWLGFEKGYWAATVGNGVLSGPVRGDYLSVPVWFLLLASGVLPASWGVGAARRRRRARGGLCRRCGYDLRATPARCPECGAVPGDDQALAAATR